MKNSCLLCLLFVLLMPFLVAQELRTEFQDTPPKYLRNQEGEFGGLCVELITLIQKNTPVMFSHPGYFIPLRRIESNLASGETDVHFGFSRTAEREKSMVFGEELYEVSVTLVANSDDPVAVGVKTLDDVKRLGHEGLVLAVGGSGTVSMIKDAGLQVDAGTSDINQNLEKLASRRARFFAYHDLGLIWAINQPQFMGKFRLVPLVICKDQHWVVFSKSVPKSLVALIVDSIRKLKASGAWSRITSRYLVSP